MKILLCSVFALSSFIAFGQNPQYDDVLAQSLGADDYGMKAYTFVVLKTGPLQDASKAFADSCFAGHMANIQLLVAEKKLVLAGPFGKNTDQFRGLFVLNTTSPEEALGWLAQDAAIAAGLLTADTYPWYGSAALPVYLEAADKVWRVKP